MSTPYSRKDVDWAARRLKRDARRAQIEATKKPPLDEDDPPHEHVFNGKKHCRICGERELNVWLDKMIWGTK